jgi:hypothetical protein
LLSYIDHHGTYARTHARLYLLLVVLLLLCDTRFVRGLGYAALPSRPFRSILHSHHEYEESPTLVSHTTCIS